MSIRSVMALSLLTLTLVACGQTSTPPPDPATSTPLPESPVDQSPLSPPPTPAPPQHTSPLPDPSSSPIETPAGAADQVVAAAREHLAQEAGVAMDDMKIRSIEPVDWPDAGLGCPKPGKAYAQVITPGYRIVIEVAGREHELHTDLSGQAIVICEQTPEKES